MTRQEQIIQVIREELGSGIEAKPETVILNASGLDENTIREIIMKIEEEFGIEIPDKDAEELHTVKDVVDYVIEVTKESGKE